MIQLEEDQRRLVDGVRSSMAAGNRWVLMQGATGSGKTVMAADIIHGSRNKGTRSMMVVPRRDLILQSAETLRAYDIPFSYCAAGYEMNPFARTFLATTQTLLRRIKKGLAPQVDLVLPDETHHGGDGLETVIEHYKAQRAYGIGLTATPWLLSGEGLGCWYDDMVCGESIAWLIAAKRLSEYRMFAPSRPDLSKMKIIAGDYSKSDLSSYMRTNTKLIGDAVKHYRDHAMGKLNIAYCTSVEHSELVASRFNEAGIPAASIDGKKSDEERARIIKAFARREILVLCNCELLTFGFDLSAASGMDVTVEAMSDLRPTKSLALQMQKWGRVLRRKPFPAMIFDHGGNVQEHGFPDDPRDWTLEGVEKKSSGRGGVPVKNCNGGWQNPDLSGRQMLPCYFSHRPSPRCPNCGAWYETDSRILQTVEGTLEEIQTTVRRDFTLEERARLREAIDELTKNGIKNGMPASIARKWATKKAGDALIEKISRPPAQLQISLHAGGRELEL